MKLILTFILTFTLSVTSFAGDSSVIESMHENGKIYPVIAILSVIFIGIVLFLVRQEKKIKHLEEEIKDNQK